MLLEKDSDDDTAESSWRQVIGSSLIDEFEDISSECQCLWCLCVYVCVRLCDCVYVCVRLCDCV